MPTELPSESRWRLNNPFQTDDPYWYTAETLDQAAEIVKCGCIETSRAISSAGSACEADALLLAIESRQGAGTHKRLQITGSSAFTLDCARWARCGQVRSSAASGTSR